jgi:hypothetical protein
MRLFALLVLRLVVALERRQSRELGVNAVLFDEFRVCALLFDLASFEHHNLVRIANGTEAVRHHNGGAAAHHIVQRRLHNALRLRVQSAGRLHTDTPQRSNTIQHHKNLQLQKCGLEETDIPHRAAE